jgi:hypothetical protein
MRDQAGAFIGNGRAAVGVGRRNDDDDPAILHRLELATQQERLCAGFPGVRHRFGGGFVIAWQRPPAEIDARRDDEPVVGQARACASMPVAACLANAMPSAASLS